VIRPDLLDRFGHAVGVRSEMVSGNEVVGLYRGDLVLAIDADEPCDVRQSVLVAHSCQGRSGGTAHIGVAVQHRVVQFFFCSMGSQLA